METNYSKVQNENDKNNFRTTLQYQAQGDIEMKAYLESSGEMKYTTL